MLLIVGSNRLPADRLDDARPAMAAMVAASRAKASRVDNGYAVDILDPGGTRRRSMRISPASISPGGERHGPHWASPTDA